MTALVCGKPDNQVTPGASGGRIVAVAPEFVPGLGLPASSTVLWSAHCSRKGSRGFPVEFPVTREPDGTARHRVEVIGLGTWLTSRLGFDPRHAVTLLDWLAAPAQRLAEIISGEIFHDAPGELSRAQPYRVIGAGRFAAALREAITDPRIGELPLTGAIDQFIDSTDAIGELRFLRACAAAAIG